VDYVFQFGVVWQNIGSLLGGAWLTVELSAVAMVLGLLVGILGALGKTSGPRPLRRAIGVYVEVIRNTPFLVQLFVIYLGLPTLGLRLTANQAALAALTINLGAYTIEIVRAGIEAIPRGQIEAGLALGLRRLQVFRLIILVPTIRTVFPALASQFILLMLGTSVVSAIAADELTATANTLQSRTFRSFEIYLVVTGLYLVLSLAFRGVFAAVWRLLVAPLPAAAGRGRR
jgi:polar amino acid transport system permease protein